MYTNAVDQVRGMRQPIELPFRLAKVTSLSDGRAYVQFYGESSASTKLYPYIEGYKPTVGDDVLLVVQGETFIIMGKLSKDNITDNYFLLKSAEDALYLTEAAADERYQPKSDTKVKRIYSDDGDTAATLGFYKDGNNKYYLGGWQDMSQGTKLNFGRADSTGNRFGIGCFDQLGGAGQNYAIQTLNVRDVNLYGNITPSGNKTLDLGTSSAKMKNIYAGNSYSEEAHIDKVVFGTSTKALTWDNSNSRLNLPTGVTFSIGSGTSNQLNNVYAKQFYQNGTAISTSDKRKKKSIKNLAKQYVEFFKNLRPRTFKFKDGESDRIHTGFIAQEVEEAAGAVGIDNKDLAFLCIDKDGSYGLRYEELIAVQTAVIQDLLKRVEALEIKVNGRSES